MSRGNKETLIGVSIAVAVAVGSLAWIAGLFWIVAHIGRTCQ